MAFRYLCLTARFNTRLNFTFAALRAAQRGLTRLQDRVWEWSLSAGEDLAPIQEMEACRSVFWGRVNDNLDMPGALSQAWRTVHLPLSPSSRLQLLLEFDEVLGLGLSNVLARYKLPSEANTTLQERAALREERRYSDADSLRQRLHTKGYVVRDTNGGTRARPMTDQERRAEAWPEVSSSQEVPSLTDHPDAANVSFVLLACNYQDDVQRCIQSALRWTDAGSVEVVAVDNGSTDGTSRWLEELAQEDPRVRVIHTDHILGDAAAKNIGLKQSLGRIVILLDTSAEVTGDLYTPLSRTLRDLRVGMAGPFGLITTDLRHFDEVTESAEVDAMQAYCSAFRRADLTRVGWMPESFRFYRNLDIQFSFQFRASGFKIVADRSLPVYRHEHRQWSELAEEERDKLSHNNFRRFLKRWDHRKDLLVINQS